VDFGIGCKGEVVTGGGSRASFQPEAAKLFPLEEGFGEPWFLQFVNLSFKSIIYLVFDAVGEDLGLCWRNARWLALSWSR
jgi:hypothetical protein